MVVPAFGVLLLPEGALSRPEAVAEVGRAALDLGYASVWATSPELLEAVRAPLPLGLRTDRRPRPVRVPLARVAVPRQHVVCARVAWPAAQVLHTGAGPVSGADGRWVPLRDLDVGHAGEVVVVHALRPTPDELLQVLTSGAAEVVVALPGARELDALLSGFADAAECLAQF